MYFHPRGESSFKIFNLRAGENPNPGLASQELVHPRQLKVWKDDPIDMIMHGYGNLGHYGGQVLLSKLQISSDAYEQYIDGANLVKRLLR